MTSASPVYRCSKCAREYTTHPPPPSCVRCLRPLMRLVDGWAGQRFSHLPREARVLTALELRGRKHVRRKAGAILGPVLGELVPDAFFLVVTGLPGLGKSTWVLRALDSGVWKKPILVAGEEGLDGVGLADRCARLEVTKTRFSDAQNFPEIADLVEREKPDALALDSVTALGLEPADALELRRHFPDMTVIAVVQSTKDGGFAGSQAWAHDADVFVTLPELGKFAVTKSWFSAIKEGSL